MPDLKRDYQMIGDKLWECFKTKDKGRRTDIIGGYVTLLKDMENFPGILGIL